MTIELSKKDCRLIVQEDHVDYEVIDRIDMGKNGSWHNMIEIIFKELKTNYDYRFYYNQAATEYQEDEYSDSICYRVKLVEVTTKKWIAGTND